VRAGTRGSYSSALKLTSINDTNPANDSGQVTFEISAQQNSPAPKSGGGGRFEWLSLVLLAWLAWRRTSHSRSGTFH
jgi:hypothetical protein